MEDTPPCPGYRSICWISCKIHPYRFFFNQFLPSTIGGDVYRAFDSIRQSGLKIRPIAVLLVERGGGIIILFLFASIAILIGEEISRGIPKWIGLLLLSFIFFSILLFLSRIDLRKGFLRERGPVSGFSFFEGIKWKIHEMADAVMDYKEKKVYLYRAFAISIILQLNVILYYFLLSISLNLSVSILNFFLIIPLITVILMIPVTINGIGMRENSYVFFLAPLGISSSISMAYAWLDFGFMLFLGIIGGLIYAFKRK